MRRTDQKISEMYGSSSATEEVMGPSLPKKKKKFNPENMSMSMYNLSDDNANANGSNNDNETPLSAAPVSNTSSSSSSSSNAKMSSKMSPGMRGKIGSRFNTESVKMKLLFESSVQRKLRNVENTEPTVNPLWTHFPSKCVKTISSVEEMREKLQYFSHTDEVMVVQYSQENCTACNAVGKITEMLCHAAERDQYKIHFYEVNKNELPELARGLVRFPQVKGFSGGQWTDIDFKPPADFRNDLYNKVEKEVQARNEAHTPVTALQAEEMYYSSAAPAMTEIMQENLLEFYCKSQVRLHNYWKQISVRRSWFYKKFIAPHIEESVRDDYRLKSVLGEKIVYGPQMPDNFEA